VSAIGTTNAVVLRSVKFQESSRIVTFYTERFGRLAGIVKGARRNPGRFGTSLQPMSQVNLVVYRKPGRDVQTVSQCDLAFPYRRIPLDLDLMSAGLQMVELVTLVTHDDEENRELYALLAGALRRLDAGVGPGWTVLYSFELRLAGILGFRPDFTRCAGCGRLLGSELLDGGMVRIDIEHGGPVCRACDTPGRRTLLVSAAELGLLAELSAGPPGEGEGSAADGGRNDRVERFLFEFYSYHLPGFRRLRSGEVFRLAEEGPPRGGAGGGNS
jgi:DNA repair protein RecO (recombination protein O)